MQPLTKECVVDVFEEVRREGLPLQLAPIPQGVVRGFPFSSSGHNKYDILFLVKRELQRQREVEGGRGRVEREEGEGGERGRKAEREKGERTEEKGRGKEERRRGMEGGGGGQREWGRGGRGTFSFIIIITVPP